MKIQFAPLFLILFAAPFILVDVPADSPSLQSPSAQTPIVDKTDAEEVSYPSRTPPKAKPSKSGSTREGSASATIATTPPQTTPDSAPPPAQAPASLSREIEAEVLRLMNIERASEGLGTLSFSQLLREIAWSHSADMLINNYFSHDRPDGCSSSCRATNAGYAWQTVGENIYMMSGFTLSDAEAAKMIVSGWMQSEGHRKNILRSAFTEVGVGVASDGKSHYITALYARPR